MASVLKLMFGKEEKIDPPASNQPNVFLLFDLQKFELHSDLWFTIFEFLNPIELIKFSQTSKRSQQLVLCTSVSFRRNAWFLFLPAYRFGRQRLKLHLANLLELPCLLLNIGEALHCSD